MWTYEFAEGLEDLWHSKCQKCKIDCPAQGRMAKMIGKWISLHQVPNNISPEAHWSYALLVVSWQGTGNNYNDIMNVLWGEKIIESKFTVVMRIEGNAAVILVFHSTFCMGNFTLLRHFHSEDIDWFPSEYLRVFQPL